VSIYWANAQNGFFSPPPTVGSSPTAAASLRPGEFQGRTIFVRYIWSDITADSAHFEQSFSDDGGKT